MTNRLETLKRGLLAGWNTFFFAPSAGLNLAITRIVVCLTSLWVVLSRDLPATSGLPDPFWQHVDTLTRWRYLLFPGHEQMERGLQALAIVALFLLLFGIWTRFTAILAAALLYHLAPLETIFWTSSPYLRGLTLPIIALVALSASPCGDALSLTNWRRNNSERAASWEYGWAIRVVQIEVCFVYFFSGYSKLVDVGWAWLDPATLRSWLLALNQNRETQVFSTLGPWLAEYPWLCFMMGAGSLLLELTFPLVLFSKVARWILLPAAVLMHIGIVLSFNITILFLPLFAAFIDWNWLWQRWKRRQATPAD